MKILCGDWVEMLNTLPDSSVHCCVTSPPYWGLRDYGVAGQLGLEKTPEEYVEKMVAEPFAKVARVIIAVVAVICLIKLVIRVFGSPF